MELLSFLTFPYLCIMTFLEKYKVLQDKKYLKEEKVRALFSFEKKIKRTTIEQYNKELDRAVEQINKGEFFKHEDVERESVEW